MQEQRVAAGLCLRCGEPRRADGTRWYCRYHANEHSETAKRIRTRNRLAGLCDKCYKPRGEGNGRTRFLCLTCSPIRIRRSKSKGWRWSQYGITDSEYEQLLLEQKGGCAICGKSQKGRALAVDHNWKTGRVRGLLCIHCNTAIGKFNDDPNILRKVIHYLEKESGIGLHRSRRAVKKRRVVGTSGKDLQDIVRTGRLETPTFSPMAKITYGTCRWCSHKFIPRVEYPRQCGKCWRLWPLGKPPTKR